MESQSIEITKDFYVGLKKRYKEAIAANETQFTYEGIEYLTAYAKYLLQYLDGKFPAKYKGRYNNLIKDIESLINQDGDDKNDGEVVDEITKLLATYKNTK